MPHPFDGKTDKEVMEHLLLSAMFTKLHGDNAEMRDTSAALEPLLRRCLEKLEAADKNATKLINVSEDLAVERASNRKLKAAVQIAADLLCGDPYTYPPEVQAVALAVHEANGTLDAILKAHGRTRK